MYTSLANFLKIWSNFGNGPTRARCRWPWSGRRSWFSGGTIRFLSPETRLRSSAAPVAACSTIVVFLSHETSSQDEWKSGGVVQGVLHIDMQELLLLLLVLLLLLQAVASILLFLLLDCLLAGRRCCCVGLGFHCSVSRYFRCSIVWCLVPGNSF
jgi:hypothetical protein